MNFIYNYLNRFVEWLKEDGPSYQQMIMDSDKYGFQQRLDRIIEEKLKQKYDINYEYNTLYDTNHCIINLE